MPTTNPVPSQDPSDLLFNAGKLDEVLNGTGTSFTDRLGVARRTVSGMNADFDDQLADAESDLNVYRADAAASAAQALGYLNTIRTTSYGAYASDPATDPMGNPPTVGDEYFNTTANLLKRWNGTTWQASDINTANLAAPSGSSLIGFQPAGADSLDTTVEKTLLRTVHIYNFMNDAQIADAQSGAATLDLSAAFQNAVAHCKLTGDALDANSGDTYNLGAFPNTTGAVKILVDFDGFVFNTNNCKFKATYNANPSLAASTKMTLIKLHDVSNVVIGDFKAEADYCERTGTAQGITALWVHNEAKNARNLTIGSISGSKLYATIVCGSADPATYRFRGIVAKNLFNDGGYYNVNFTNNGDDFVAKIHSNNVVRSYFVYGVSGHKAKVYSTNHLKFTDVLVKRYEYDTNDIHIDYSCPSDLSSGASVSIEHQNDTDTGTIQNVYIDFDVVKSNPANPTINFASFDSSGLIRGTTSSVTDNIHIRGKTNSYQKITFQSVLGGINGENVSRLFVQKDLFDGVSDFKRFIVNQGGDRIIARGNASTGMAIKINVSNLKFTPNYGLLTVWAADNPGASAAEYIIRQYFVLFSVASNGNVIIPTTTTIATQTAGVLAPNIQFVAQTGTFDLRIEVANYTNANRQCSATLDVFRVA